MPSGERVGDFGFAFVPLRGNRGKVSGAVPLLHFQGCLVHQLNETGFLSEVIVL